MKNRNSNGNSKMNTGGSRSIELGRRSRHHGVGEHPRPRLFHFYYLRLGIFFGCVGIFFESLPRRDAGKDAALLLPDAAAPPVCWWPGKYLAGLATAIFLFVGSTALSFLLIAAAPARLHGLHPARSRPQPARLLHAGGGAGLHRLRLRIPDERHLLPQSDDPGGGRDGVGKPEPLPSHRAQEDQRDLLPEKSLPGGDPDSPALQRDGDRRGPDSLLDCRPGAARTVADPARLLRPLRPPHRNQLRGVTSARPGKSIALRQDDRPRCGRKTTQDRPRMGWKCLAFPVQKRRPESRAVAAIRASAS